MGLNYLLNSKVNKNGTRQDINWPVTADSMVKSNPKGLRKVLKWMDDRYHSGLSIIVAASGLPGEASEPPVGSYRLKDFKKSYINEALKGKLEYMD